MKLNASALRKIERVVRAGYYPGNGNTTGEFFANRRQQRRARRNRGGSR